MRGLGAFQFLLLVLQATANPVNKREELENLQKDDLERDESISEHINRINNREHEDLFEGDIVLLEKDKEIARVNDEENAAQSSGRLKRNAQRARQYLWRDRVVPYDFDPSFPAPYQGTIQSAIAEYHKSTCLRFVPRTKDSSNWIHFTNKSGCWSSVGKSYWTNGGQELSLGQGCNHKGTVMHEMMHAIGFWHEQSRPDRNQYVEVLWENIAQGKEHNFNKYSHGTIDRQQVPYDFNSIMHYGKTSFSKNGKPTIRSIHNPDQELGQRIGFTDLDIHEINTLYDCSNKGKGWSNWSRYGACDKSCFKIRQRFCTSNNPDTDCPGHRNGIETEDVKCSDQECNAAVDGHWGRWSPWGSCSTTCGKGVQTRTRLCDDPTPDKGGKHCVGDSKMSQECQLKRCGQGPDDCEFDNDGFCHWQNYQSAKYFYWQRGSGSTPSSLTGPSGDHTTGSDHYIYVESSSPAQSAQKANLLSKKFPATSGRCVSFWYHMFGPGTGDLTVYIKDGQTGALNELWTKSGDQGDKWLNGEISIKSDAEYQIVFEAIRGSDFTGDIALDDVKFQDGLCSKDRPSYVKVGCFRDQKKPYRAIPILIANLRGQIDWYHLEKTVQKCAELARQKNYQIFAIQFYGECRSGSDSQVDYDKYGAVDDSKCPMGVGGPNVNAVYRIV